VTTHPRERRPHCPHCGLTRSEESVPILLDQLFQSHTELCTMLRSAARQMLRFEKQDDGSLEKIRKVLKRADQVRQLLRGPDELPGAAMKLSEDDMVGEPPTSVSEYTPGQVVNEGSTPC
jgi:hypothetical protein